MNACVVFVAESMVRINGYWPGQLFVHLEITGPALDTRIQLDRYEALTLGETLVALAKEMADNE
jgi:hypothetical protein